MSYVKEFNASRITVPSFLLGPGWEDVSWHNDVCPRFENEELLLAVWVDYDDPDERKQDDWKKYTVCGFILHANDAPTLSEEDLFATEDADALETWLSLYAVNQHLDRAHDELCRLEKPDMALADELASLRQLVKEHMEDVN